MEMEAEIGVVQPKVKGRHGPQKPGERHGANDLSELLEETSSAGILIFGLSASRTGRESILGFFKPPIGWQFVTAGLGN